MIVIVAFAWILTGAILLAVGYRAVFAIGYLSHRRRRGSDSPDSPASAKRFLIVIPAHDEELLIGHAISSIRAADYPQELLDIHVIADNCSDRTAERARQLGARVFERNEPEDRGKGQALRWMFAQLDLSRADAVALVDADVLVEPGFFREVNRALDGGARCVQGYNGVANPDQNSMTRLLAVTNVIKNLLFNGGKAALGMSVVLSTGVVFVREVIERIGWDALSIGEDLEQTIRLIELGERIEFVPDARTQAQEASTLKQGFSQRQRWATGRRALARRARRVLFEGIRRRSLELADVGLDLLMPTYSKLINWTAVALVLALLLHSVSPWLLVAVGTALIYQIFEFAAALVIMRAKPRFAASLAFAPVFLVWKAVIDALAVLGYQRSAWIRTARDAHPNQPSGKT